MTNKLRALWAWFTRHFDAALILAAAVEIPRWTVTFLAIHEPLWVGIPLGALLAYATSEGWKAYFIDRRRWMLLTFNAASLLAAVFVITPVLFSMANAPIDEIDLATIMPPMWLLAWSAVLAMTTFAPLIQLAAVKSGYSQPQAQPDVTPATETIENARHMETAPVQPEQATMDVVASQATQRPCPRKVRKSKQRASAAQRQAQIASSGLDDAGAIAATFGVSVRTAQADLAQVRKATTTTNGVHA